MNNAILVNNITPEQLTKTILEGVKSEIQELKEHYQPKEPDQWLSRKDAVELLGISYVTLHDWINKGIIKAYKMGNKTFFSRKEINDQMFNSNK